MTRSASQALYAAIESKPVGTTHWTVRSAAAASGLSKSTVARKLTLSNVRHHRNKTFRLSSESLFVDKVRDIIGIYLNLPDHALVLCVDEKTQVWALKRRQPDRVPRSGVGPGISRSLEDWLDQAVIDDGLTSGSSLKAVIVSKVM